MDEAHFDGLNINMLEKYLKIGIYKMLREKSLITNEEFMKLTELFCDFDI